MLIFLFIAGTCLYGFFAVLFFSQATEINSTQTVSISAMVPGAEEGPAITQSSSPSGGGSVSPRLAPNFPLKRIMAGGIIPTNSAGQIILIGDKGEEISVELFKTQFPSFSGKVNVPKAIIHLQIKNKVTLRSTTMASSDGNWQWQSKQPLFLGNNTLTVTVEDPNDFNNTSIETLDFYIDPTLVAGGKVAAVPEVSKNQYTGNLFDVMAIVPEYFKAISAGSELVINVRLINFGSAGKPVDVIVQYEIQNVRGESILKASETLAVATQLSYLKTFYTSKSLEDGPYQVIITVPSKNIVATAYDNFQITKKPPLIPAITASTESDKTKNGIVGQALLGIMFLAAMVAYFEYNKTSQLSKIIKRVGDAEFISAA